VDEFLERHAANVRAQPGTSNLSHHRRTKPDWEIGEGRSKFSLGVWIRHHGFGICTQRGNRRLCEFRQFAVGHEIMFTDFLLLISILAHRAPHMTTAVRDVYTGRWRNVQTINGHHSITIQCPIVWIDGNRQMLFITSDNM
jgi:hypothetical protein